MLLIIQHSLITTPTDVPVPPIARMPVWNNMNLRVKKRRTSWGFNEQLTDAIALELATVNNEVNSLTRSNVAEDVISLLSKKRDFLFNKYVLSILNVKDKFLLEGKLEAAHELENQLWSATGTEPWDFIQSPTSFAPSPKSTYTTPLPSSNSMTSISSNMYPWIIAQLSNDNDGIVSNNNSIIMIYIRYCLLCQDMQHL
jgi:hypothetical protein